MATTTPATPATTARIWNVVLGVWLFISAFLWPHSETQMTNTWIMGVLSALFAVASIYYSPARYLNVALAVWLFISSWALPTIHAATTWNNLLVAVAIFVVALIPGPVGAEPPRFFPRPRAPT